MKLTEYWKQRCEAAEAVLYYLRDENSEFFHEAGDKWRELLNTPEPEECKHEHKIKVFLNDEYTICQNCNAFIG